jgi:hypothetical protein
MTITTVRMRNVRREWEEIQLPVSRETLETMRKTWRTWLKQHQRPGVEGNGTEAGAARSVVGIDDMKVSGFDKLMLGIAVVAKSIQYVD